MISKDTQAPRTVAISISESPNIAYYGLSEGHLREAMADYALYLLHSGLNLAYGGNLRTNGFTKLLFELVQRYRWPDSARNTVTNYLAWPVHIRMALNDLNALASELCEFGKLALIGKNGCQLTMEDRHALPTHEPDDSEWVKGLTEMRQVMRERSDARILLGGRVTDYKGEMPGIAEEAFLSLQSGQPVFIVGGFGGCARDIAETLRLTDNPTGSHSDWPGRDKFKRFSPDSVSNGLSLEENQSLATTPYIDEAVTLVLIGLDRLFKSRIDNYSERKFENDA